MKRLLIIPAVIFLALFSQCKKDNTQQPEVPGKYPLHMNITSTYFYIGEPSTADNGYIPNSASAWDDGWKNHYGGIDDPDNRNGYYPAGFTPRENPFYFALPYNDMDSNGVRKIDAAAYVYWAKDTLWGEVESMCKNKWIKITKGSKTCYAQWEDTGPFIYDDKKYVFGTAQPTNTENQNAGLDVSPAVRDYLLLGGMGKVDWQFIDIENVPDGPWKTIITTRQISWGN